MSLRSFVLYHTLKVQLCYLQLGLELQLYAPHELPYVYWYLQSSLCTPDSTWRMMDAL